MTGKQSSLRAYGAQKSAVVGGGERGESTADVAIVQAGGGIGGSEKAREVTAGCGGGSEIRFLFSFFSGVNGANQHPMRPMHKATTQRVSHEAGWWLEGAGRKCWQCGKDGPRGRRLLPCTDRKEVNFN